MNTVTTRRSDRFGLVRPGLEAHTLGIYSVYQLLQDCRIEALIGDARICEAFAHPQSDQAIEEVERWLRLRRITMLGFSYRLDPEQGAELFARWVHRLQERRLLARQGGPIRGLFFAGLPTACERVRQIVPEVSGVFAGDETPLETLAILGIETAWAPDALSSGMAYDEGRMAFAKELIRRGDYHGVKPVDRAGYEGYGTKNDTLAARVADGRKRGLPPVIRAHVGPFLPEREEAVRLFVDWTKSLAAAGLLDVLSIGTSQLTQSNFEENWDDKPNGGGVPVNSRREYANIHEAARPMLVRTYAGALAQVNDQTISMKPLRTSPEDKEVVVKTEVKGRGEPIQLDYRLEKTPGQGACWKIYNLNVLGVWLVETYRSQFAQEISAKGIDGLIAALTERNKTNAKKV